MFFKNAKVFTTDGWREGGFEVTNEGKFGQILPAALPEDAVNLNGAKVIPGLVDVHIHGAMGADFSDGDAEGLKRMAQYLLKEGITSFTPASMTLPYETLKKAFLVGKALAEEDNEDCARLMGAHMEGPYFSEKKKGAQNGAYLKNPDFAGFKALQDACDGFVKIVDVAPELPGAADFVRAAKALCTVSIAHTDSDYEHAKAAVDAGVTHLTHLYNAMPGIHHRNPGVIPAAVENQNVRAELICDGIHVHPASVRLAFQMFGAERVVLISDALRCCGMPDGEYELGGQTVYLADGVGRLVDGTIAGAVTNLFEGMRRAISFGIDECDAIRAATLNPAKAIDADCLIGSITSGKYADFVVCNDDYSQKRVFKGGKEVK